jgi:5'-3' exonuclease
VIFLVDASVYVFRAYHSMLPDMRDRDGNPAHAVFGFARFLGDLIERVRPGYMAVAFDERGSGSYRSRIYPPYKANRERAPADLVLQFQHCRELCRCLGLPAFVDPEYEADDIIGTLAGVMRGAGVRSAFITRDKDLAQLMRDGDLFWDFGARGQFGYHDIERHFGVRPERFAERLGEYREAVFLARQLTRIACNLRLGVAAAALRRRAPDLPALSELYDRLGFGPYLRRQGERLAQLPAS